MTLQGKTIAILIAPRTADDRPAFCEGKHVAQADNA
jgi:hypothetical protein